MSLRGKHGPCSAARMGTVHPPSCWQDELQDCVSSAIRPDSLYTSTADLSALYNKQRFPLRPAFQSVSSPKWPPLMTAWMGRLLSAARACHSQLFPRGTQVEGKRTPGAFEGGDDARTDDHEVDAAAAGMMWELARCCAANVLVPVCVLCEHFQHVILPATL